MYKLILSNCNFELQSKSLISLIKRVKEFAKENWFTCKKCWLWLFDFDDWKFLLKWEILFIS